MSAKLLGMDTVAIGSWIGNNRGRDGHLIASDQTSATSGYPYIAPALPSYIDSVDLAAGSSFSGTFIYSPGAPRYDSCLEIPGYSARTPTNWAWASGTSAVVTIIPNDTDWHFCSLYFVESANSGSRSQSVTVGGDTTPTFLANSPTPPWVRFAFQGETAVVLNRMGGGGIWLAGVFFDSYITNYAGGGHDGIVGSYLA